MMSRQVYLIIWEKVAFGNLFSAQCQIFKLFHDKCWCLTQVMSEWKVYLQATTYHVSQIITIR